MAAEPCGCRPGGEAWTPNLSWITDDLAVGGRVPLDRIAHLAEALGIGALVDLREEDRDDEAHLRRHGIAFLHLPTADHGALTPEALDFLAATAGPDAVRAFAEQAMAPVEQAFSDAVRAGGEPAAALVDVLNSQGYVASLQPVASGEQLCQYHCPVAHVAREFPELCAAETALFAELLGSHVQRLATIAHGDGVCTTHIPHPVERKVS